MSINANKLTILVADDSVVNLTLLQEIYSNEYNVKQAENGYEA